MDRLLGSAGLSIALVSHVVMCMVVNLYNNEFAGGFVAAVLIAPIFEILKGFVKI